MTFLYENNAAGTLAAAITNAATSLTLNAGQAALFPNPTAPDTFYATLTDAATQTLIEIVLVTAVSGNVMQIQRGQDGSTPQSWNPGDILSQRTVAAELRQWQGIVPIGGIIMWSGAETAIPENWALCNGTAGTPNLIDRFVVGVGDLYTVGQTGGTTNALINHTHGVTDPTHVHGVFDPSHQHLSLNGGYLEAVGGINGLGSGGTVGVNVSTAAAFTGIGIDPAATGISIQQQGNTTSSLPPFYALCFIMRVS